MCMFFRSLSVSLCFFLLTIVLSVLLLFTDSDYPFGIFKLVFQFQYNSNEILKPIQRHQARGESRVTLNDLTPPHFCSCSKLGHGFSTSYVVVCFVFSELRWGVIVGFCCYWWNWWSSLIKLSWYITLFVYCLLIYGY